MRSPEQAYRTDARVRIQQTTRRVRNIGAIPLIVAALLTHPTIVQAPESEKTRQIQKQIEQQYNIRLEGPWNDEQLEVLNNILANLPPSVIQAHPGKLTQFVVNPENDGSENASCACFTYPHEGKNLGPNKIQMGHKIFENPRLAYLVVTHELMHAKDQYITARKTSEGWKFDAFLWHEDMLNEILQKPFADFAEEIDKKLQRQYPELYQLALAKYAQTRDPSTSQKLPKSFGEQMTAKNMREFNKVARWLYAVSKGPHSHMYQTMASKYPIEFIPVLAEWYMQGKEVFMYNMEGVISKDMAEALYEFLRIKIFDRVEYTEDVRAIKPPQRQEITPLHRGRY